MILLTPSLDNIMAKAYNALNSIENIERVSLQFGGIRHLQSL
ncbi:MAG: hypothetical protein ACI97H_001371 [Marinobacter psychrophilus]